MTTPSVPTNKWTIFLSHSSKDNDFTDWLSEKLKASNVAVWHDKFELLSGDSLIQRIEEGLRGSEFLIVIVSQAAIESNWVHEELETKLLQQIERGQVTILPIALDDAKVEDISIFLKGRVWIRFPRIGSDEKFEELLRGINGQLRRRGLLP
jgi:hypothetical protein